MEFKRADKHARLRNYLRHANLVLIENDEVMVCILHSFELFFLEKHQVEDF